MCRTICAIIWILLFIPMALFASSLFVFDMDHPIYDEMDALYIAEGKASASGIRPWTEKDAERYLSYINPVTETGKALKERISSYITDYEKDFVAAFGGYATLGAGVHTNPSDFSYKSDWFRGDEMDEHLLGLEFKAAWKDHVAAFSDISVGVNDADTYKPEEENDWEYSQDDRYGNIFGTNIIYISGNGFSTDFPTRAYVTAGVGPFMIKIGRDRLSWGNGMMGNMMLGDTLPWHDHLSVTANGSDWFQYQMLISFFSHSEDSHNWFRVPVTGLRFFLGHRLEFSFLSHTLKFAFNDSIMYQSPDNYFDFRALNPVFFMHNLYTGGNANSLVTAEAEWSPVKNLTIYAQAALDEFVFVTENSIYPNAWGVMAGVKTTIPRGENYFYGGFEFVYLNPYMYHRIRDNGESSEYLRDLHYVGTLKEAKNGTSDGGGQSILSRYLSFPFGSDTIAAQIRFGYKDMDFFTLESNILFSIHGDTDMWTEFGEYGINSEDSGIKEYSLVFGGEGEIRPLDWLGFTGSLYFNLVWNKDNVEKPVVFDMQFAVGATFRY